MAQLPAGWLVVTVRGRSWRRVEQGAAQVLEEAEAVWGHGHAADSASELGSVASRVLSEVRADQRAWHDSLNPAASRAAMDGSLAADFFSASISR